MSPSIDNIDEEILAILTEDARSSFIGISKQLNLSEATIRNRVSRLEKDGVIKKYSIIVDHKKIGYDAVAIIGLDVEPSQFLEISHLLSTYPEIRSVSTCTGDHMVLCEVWAKTGKSLSDFITERITSLEGVTKVCPAIIHEQIKI